MIDVKTKFISVLIFTMAPDETPAFTHQAALVMQRKVPLLHGFVEGAVMANEEKTQVLLVTQWESRDAWSAAQWNDSVSNSLGDFVESASTFEFRTYEPITIVRA
jgi:heme-degrading monooxygenase HmoA